MLALAQMDVIGTRKPLTIGIEFMKTSMRNREQTAASTCFNTAASCN